MRHEHNPEDTTTRPAPASDHLYRRVVDRHAAGVFDQANQALTSGGAIDEPGLLRLVLARLLTQEYDAGRVAQRASGLANAVARLVTAQRRSSDQRGDELSKAIRDIQHEFDAMHAAANAAATSPDPEGAQP